MQDTCRFGNAVATIGDYAFRECGRLTTVTFGNALTTIGESAFYDCQALESVTLPSSVSYVGHYAFENCTALSSIDLGKVQELGYYVFRGCSALTSLTIPASLTTAGYGYYYGPLADSSITSVTFEEGIANIPGYICAGASALVQVRLPEKEDTVDGYKIGNYAFSNCSFLSDINIPNSITAIGDYAFANCKNLGTIRLPSSISSLSRTVFQDSKVENVLIAKEDSPVALALIDSEIPYTADESGIQDAPGRYLNRETSGYRTAASSVSTAGTVKLVIDYEFKDNVENQVSDLAVQIKLPSAVEVTSGSVRLGETAIDYEESDGFVTIPVTETKGTIYCTVEPNDTSYLLSYAKMQYTLGGDSKSEVIGIVNLQTEMLTLNVPNEVKTKTVHISGFANPKSEVSVYLDDEFVDTFTASAVGNYSADISLANPEQGKFYAIEVKSTDNSGNEITALDYVQYNTKSPELTQFTMYYRNSEYDLIELSGTSPIVSWAANTTFTFIIDFDDNKNMDVVKVVSTKGNEVRTITAVYDPENDYYIATGFYNYIPGTLSVEYKEYPDFSKLEGVTVETEDTYTLDDSEKTNGYLVRLDMMDEKGSSLY